MLAAIVEVHLMVLVAAAEQVSKTETWVVVRSDCPPALTRTLTLQLLVLCYTILIRDLCELTNALYECRGTDID